MNASGTKPQLLLSTSETSKLISPPGYGRSLSESPCITLNVASVAMIDGSPTLRSSPALTRPTQIPIATSPNDAASSTGHDDPPPIVNDATTTIRVISAPTETSKPPIIRAHVWPIATNASGSEPLDPSSVLRLYD